MAPSASPRRAETLASWGRALARGRASSSQLTNDCLARIHDADGEGKRTFTRVYESQALAQARACDERRAIGRIASPISGIPVSIKDLFDVAGDVTTAGSAVLANDPPAARDATVLQRLKAAGAVIIGRTNMTEFAFSALGLNPHYGMPANPVDPARIPGGSSSGAAAAVAYGYCGASIGTDTAGSVRVPAAFCGLVGFKPTQSRVPRQGTFPLSASLDSIGPVAATVACCALVDEVISNERGRRIPTLRADRLRLAVPTRIWTDALDPTVGRAYERALCTISAAGVRLVERDLSALQMISTLEEQGALIGAEAYALHRRSLALRGDEYDPRVRWRLEMYAGVSAADYLDAVATRQAAVASFVRELAGFDAILAPTVAQAPPRLEELNSNEEYRRINARVRRNAGLVNLLDGCALTLPCHEIGALPAGLMIVGCGGADAHVLGIGLALERLCIRG